MSKFNDAGLMLERMAVKYEGLMQAAAALKEIGSLEQSAAEQQAKADAARQAAVSAFAELASLTEEIEQAKTQRAAKLKETDGIVAKAIHNANEQATAILAQAETEAGKIKEAELLVVNRARTDAEQRLKRMNEEYVALSAKITERKEAAQVATADADAAEKRLANIKEQIAKLAAG